jgi:hypothetical protein
VSLGDAFDVAEALLHRLDEHLAHRLAGQSFSLLRPVAQRGRSLQVKNEAFRLRPGAAHHHPVIRRLFFLGQDEVPMIRHSC